LAPGKYCIFLLLLFLAGCSKVYYRDYYILDYTPQFNKSLQALKSLPYKVEVGEIDISSSYDRSQIVVRQSLHKLRYDEYSLWAERPQEAIRVLLERHLKESGIFDEVKREFLNTRADYKVYGYLFNVEFYQSKELKRADLEMKLFFQENKSESIVVTHFIRRYEKLETDDMAFFAKKISDILKEENEKFRIKIIAYMQEKGFVPKKLDLDSIIPLNP
jgi:ABC-type uncharacterized transport system auxiliary subunit